MTSSKTELAPPLAGALAACIVGFFALFLSRSVYGMLAVYLAGCGALTYWLVRKTHGWTRTFVICAGVSWLAVFAAALTYGGKFYGFVAFIACSLSVLATSTALGRTRFAFSAIPAALYFSLFLGSAVLRQITYEIATRGHVTNLYDSCAAAFTPYIVPFTLIYLLTLGGFISMIAFLIGTLFMQPQRIKMALFVLAALLAGAYGWQNGWTGWHDAQVIQPCL